MDVTAICVRSGDWWAVTIPEVAGAFTQAKRLDQVEAMVADAVALLADVPAEDVNVDVKPELDDEPQRLLEEATTLQAEASTAQERASQASRMAVAVLRDLGLSVRDVGHLLSLSPQRISQLQQSARTFSFKVAVNDGRRTVYDAQVVRHDVDPDSPFRGRCGADLSEQPADEPFTGKDRAGETACRECARLAEAPPATVSPLRVIPSDEVGRRGPDTSHDRGLASARTAHSGSSGYGGTFPMARTERHVTPADGWGWDVEAPGGSRASAHLPTQAQAIDRAREIVTNAGGGEVVIHGRDGRIRDSDTVGGGNDPNPPRDKK